MLLDIRETVRNSKPIKYTLITLICIPFALFGVGSYFSGGGPSHVAEVGGEPIGIREFEQAYNQQRLRLQQMFGGNLPASLANEGMLRQQALDSLVTQQVLRNTVAESGFAVSDQTLAKSIQEVPAFQTDGVFDREMYRRQLQSMGMSTDQFEGSYRDDTALAQYRSGIVDTSFILPSEKERIDSLSNQIRKVDFVSFSLDAAKEGVEATDQEVSDYFDENAENYNFPERVKIQYLELSRDLISNEIDITDEEAEAYYEQNRNSYMAPEERKASHILLELDGDSDLETKTEELIKIKERIEAGESFADLASEFSADVGSAAQGGSLGQFGRGAMVPEFDEAVFSMAELGSLSDPIKTDFGLHLIRLDEIVEERGKPFNEVKNDVVNALKREKADSEFLELNEILTEESFDNPESLDSAAEATGLQIVTTDWIDEDHTGDPLLSNPRVLGAALAEDVLVEGNNSEPVELGERHVLVLRVLEHEEPRPKTLADVTDEIRDQLISDKAGESLDNSLQQVKTAFDNGDDVAAVLDSVGGDLTEDESFNRSSTTLDRNVVNDLFNLPHPAQGAPVTSAATLANGDRVLLVLKEVSVTDATENETETASPADDGVAMRLGNAEFTALLDSLRDSADVEVNQQVLDGGSSQY